MIRTTHRAYRSAQQKPDSVRLNSGVVMPAIARRRAGPRSASDELAVPGRGNRAASSRRESNARDDSAIRDDSWAVETTARVRQLSAQGAVTRGLLILAIALPVALRARRRMTSSLTRLHEVVSAIDAGQTDRRVPRLPDVELDSLGQGINRVLDSLATTAADSDVQRSRFQTIVESVNEGIVVVDADGIVTDINPAAERMFDTNARAVAGQPAETLGVFSEAEIIGGPAGGSGAAGMPIVRKHGDRVLSAVVSPLLSHVAAADSRPSAVWVLRDVTEMARVDEMKNEFVSIVSHELRTPLTAIKGFTDLILEGETGDISESQREFLEIVQANSDRLVALINDMLDISRIESGRVALALDDVDLPAAIDRAVATMRPLIEEKGLRLQTEIADNAPTVIADEPRLIQILTNLMSNAAKYTPSGGWITVRAQALESQIAISVSDTGIGIPPDALPHVFSKFYRVNQPAAREIGGTGLGLAITKSLVEMHGGRVNIASRVGVGTTVRFTMPTIPRVADEPDGKVGIDRPRPSVLIATANVEERGAWEQGLRAIPVNAIHPRGTSVAAIIAEVELRRPDVIIARCGSDSDGVPSLDDLASELSEQPAFADIPVIAIVPELNPATHGQIITLRVDVGVDEVVAAARDALPIAHDVRPIRGRVLLAEDEPDVANWLLRVLTSHGFEVTLARDGLSAMVRSVEILPDAIILDVNMPRMGASEVLPQLRGNPGTRDIPVIVISGTVPDSRPYFLEAGAADFFAKPFDADIFVRRLVQLVGRSACHG